MTKKGIFKTIGLLTLSVFAIGILSLSVRANQVQAHELSGNDSPEMGQMMKDHHTGLTSQQRQEMINLMQKHHGDNWQSHHQQMHGSQNGI
ncbi:MAG: hypothetical protein M1366_01005 [Patescibacteria group bacterium]|nr:hypothetical protein [Patescibacteria group bacterium]